MRILLAAATALTLAAMHNTAAGQDTTNPPANTLETPPAIPHTSGTGTAPEGQGSTGWTGGSRSQNPDGATTGRNGASGGSNAAAEQPEMATGKDLKGPPRQFSPRDTPE